MASSAPAFRRRDAVAAANSAARAFPAWSRSLPGERRAILNRAAALVDIHADEIRATEMWPRFNLDVGRQHLEAAAAPVTQAGG